MIEFIRQIAELLSSVLDFIVTGILMLVQVFLTLFQALGFLIAAIASIPPFAYSVVLVSVSIAAILFIINHGS